MRQFLSRTLGITAVGLAFSLLALPTNAQTVVDFGSLGIFTQSSPLSVDGVTVTSSSTLNLHSVVGLGIVGGIGVGGLDPTIIIDNGESALFTFTKGPATDVVITLYNRYATSASTATTLEAFGVGGNSLGVFTYYSDSDSGFASNGDLSSRVGGAFLSAFRITGGTLSGADLQTITYTSTVSAVPEPGEYAVMGMAGLTVCGLMVRARRRKVGAVAAV